METTTYVKNINDKNYYITITRITSETKFHNGKQYEMYKNEYKIEIQESILANEKEIIYINADEIYKSIQKNHLDDIIPTVKKMYNAAIEIAFNTLKLINEEEN